MTTANALILVALIGCLTFLRVPIYLVLLTATIYLQQFVNAMPLQAVVQNMVESIAKSSFLAIPFFMLAGNFLSESSLGDRLVNLFIVLFKKIKGGIAIASVVSNAFFGAISGSAPAAVATFSNIIFNPLEKLYGTKLALGVLTSSGTLSTIIPPSITMIIYGVATNTSTAKMFMGGFIPGIFIVLVISAYLMIVCPNVSNEQVTEITGETNFKKALWEALPVLFLPVLILGGIYGGVFTPSEAAAVASLYACVAAVVIKDITIKDIPGVLMKTAKTAGQLMVIIAAGCAFAQAATVAQLPKYVTGLFEGASQFEFLLILNIVLLIVGCLFEVGSAVMLLGPLLLPTATSLGIDPVHLGVVFAVNLAIGMFTPPFGLNIFVVQGVLKKSMGEVARSIVPFVILYFGACLVITYVPEMTLFLPRLLF